MKFRLALIAVMATGIAAAADKQLTAADIARTTRESKAAIIHKLRDPKSVEFRDLFISMSAPRTEEDGQVIARPTPHLCGEINAKNSYGGYAGFTRFVANPMGGFIEGTNDAERVAFEKAIWQTSCANKIRDVK
jgi:hypothetical protein